MALTYLSGDADMGATAKKAAKKAAKAEKKTTKKAAKATAKAEKPKVKLVAKVGLVPARNAYLAAVELNLLNLATKLARTWKSGGKDKINKLWVSMGGDPAKLKQAIIKGSKETISGTSMGVVAATTLALAAPIIVATAKIISEFKGGGDDKEKKTFDDGVNQALNDLKKNPDATVTEQAMPEGADVAAIKKKDDGTTPNALATNPVTISFIIPLLIASMHLTNPILYIIGSIITAYCVIGIVVIPFSEFAIAGQRIKLIARKYFDIPASWFNSFVNIFSHGKEA